MGALPGGIVTFVFTDVEGSTRLVEFLGDDGFAVALDAHHRIMREAIAAHGGTEASTEGDAFFVVFADAHAAVATAIDAQLAIAAYPWPDGAAVRVRIGIHTGVGTPGGDNYVGLAVHQAARIASAAHGGQIIASSETKAAAGDGICV